MFSLFSKSSFMVKFLVYMYIYFFWIIKITFDMRFVRRRELFRLYSVIFGILRTNPAVHVQVFPEEGQLFVLSNLSFSNYRPNEKEYTIFIFFFLVNLC